MSFRFSKIIEKIIILFWPAAQGVNSHKAIDKPPRVWTGRIKTISRYTQPYSHFSSTRIKTFASIVPPLGLDASSRVALSRHYLINTLKPHTCIHTHTRTPKHHSAMPWCTRARAPRISIALERGIHILYIILAQTAARTKYIVFNYAPG